MKAYFMIFPFLSMNPSSKSFLSMDLSTSAWLISSLLENNSFFNSSISLLRTGIVSSSSSFIFFCPFSSSFFFLVMVVFRKSGSYSFGLYNIRCSYSEPVTICDLLNILENSRSISIVSFLDFSIFFSRSLSVVIINSSNKLDCKELPIKLMKLK